MTRVLALCRLPAALSPSPQPGGPRGAQASWPPASCTKPAETGRLGQLEPALVLTPRAARDLCLSFLTLHTTVSVPEGREEEK